MVNEYPPNITPESLIADMRAGIESYKEAYQATMNLSEVQSDLGNLLSRRIKYSERQIDDILGRVEQFNTGIFDMSDTFREIWKAKDLYEKHYEKDQPMPKELIDEIEEIEEEVDRARVTLLRNTSTRVRGLLKLVVDNNL